ncbi:MAG: hypothetical protein SGJ09_06765 [Phycisphaerae bacterium]|nr:hypothetical protein [Phycisphaerae bacterium]
MATTETLLEQVNRADLDIHALLKLRGAIEDRLVSKRGDLMKQLEAMEGAFGTSIAARPKRGRPAGKTSTTAAPAKSNGKRKRGPNTKNSAGKHADMSVADAVRKVIGQKGGKASAGEIKKAFDAAGDRRNLNFTLLVRANTVKRVGSDIKKDGKKGRVGGVYGLG